MTYWLLAIVSTCTAFALFALAGSILARLGAAIVATRAVRHSPVAQARLLFRLRILPGLCAAAGAFAIALPIFLWFEKTDTSESVNRTLAVVALIGAFLLVRGFWRAGAAWRATARVLAGWQRRGRPLADVNAPFPAFAIEDPFPVVAVIGVWRPRLFIAERVLRECAPQEIAAMVAHECAHVSSRDNLKRLLMRACPGVLGVARRLDRAWSQAAEEAADARAAGGDPQARLDLAGALIRVARLAVPQAPPLASAFYLGGTIDDRVRRLIEPIADPDAPRWTRIAVPAAIVLLALVVVAAAPTLHEFMEEAVRLLP